MKHFVFKASLVWMGILLSIVSHGQNSDIPLGALPMEFNSSFAGEADGPRISSNVRLRSPVVSPGVVGQGSYNSGWWLNTNTSYDQFISKIRSGVGITSSYATVLNGFMNGEYSYNFYGLGIAIAPKFSLKGKYTLSPSVDILYNQSRTTYDNWADTNEKQIVNGNFLQSRVGLLFNTQKWYVGYSIYLVRQSKVRYRISTPVSSYNPLFNSYWQLGYTFQRNSESKFSFTPQLVFRTGYDYTEVFRYFRFYLLNFTFRYQKFIWGLNSAGYHIGFQNKQMRIFLTSLIKNVSSDPPYIGNLSFRYTFKTQR